jgi:predicted ATP-grasp superfamily ATP-dependent carboligase
MNEIKHRATGHGDIGVAPGALIIGGAQVSIGLARSLGRHGVPVWILADHPLPKFSRYVQRSFVWPGANHASGLSSLLALADRHDLTGWVLFATGDEDMRMIAENHAALCSRFRVMSPDWDTAKWMLDKRLTYERAASLGIDYPWSFHPQCLDDVLRLECRFPVILKPAARKAADEFTRAKAWKAPDREALVLLYKRAAALVGYDGVVIQEWIPGTGAAQFSYAGLWDRGTPIASLVARRTRQFPIDFGRSSTFVETIADSPIEEESCRLLKSLNYTGVVEVEFKYDERDRRYKLLDVNGRFWTWNALGARAGVDFGYMAWRLAQGLSVAPGRGRPGVAWMYGSRDIMAAYHEMAAGTLSLSEYLKGFCKPLVFANFAIDDPWPAFVEIPLQVLSAGPRDIQRTSGIAGSTQPRPATTK